MCGIVGVIGEKPVALEIYLGLLALKHRGTNSSGILTYDHNDNRFYLKIGAKAVDRTFSDQNFAELKGTIGIGHNRYATTANKDELYRDAQPMFTSRPGIGIAFNGHIDPGNLRSQQTSEGWNFNSSCDVEYILHMLSQTLVDVRAHKAKTMEEYVHKKLFPALTEVIQTLSTYGSFCVVCIL